jgi:hypothetical protein
VSKLRPAFLSDLFFFESGGMSDDEQNERCGLIIDRVRMSSDLRARI